MYKLNPPGITRKSDGAGIPNDPQNADYAAYLVWVSEGNTPEPADVPTLDQIKSSALLKVRSLRASFFPTLAGLQSEALARSNTTDAMAIADIQQKCRDITKLDVSTCVTKSDFEKAYVRQWYSIVSTAPTNVISAFQNLLT